MNNPFTFGNPVHNQSFINREHELRRIIDRIMIGQSIAIVGDPRTGKTSLLHNLQDKKLIDRHYQRDNKFIWVYIDGQMLKTHEEFWSHILKFTLENVEQQGKGNSLLLNEAYKICKKENFGAFALERFFSSLYKSNYRLIILLDELDYLLQNQLFENSGFLGILRSIASRSRGGFVIITASRKSLFELTRDIDAAGSPFFNIFNEMVLGPFSDAAAYKLLSPAKKRFTKQDISFIMQISGGHPYLLQAAAYAMWDYYDNMESTYETQKRYASVSQQLIAQVNYVLEDIWNHWSPKTQTAFLTIALEQISKTQKQDTVLDKETISKIKRLPLSSLKFSTETHLLKQKGYLTENSSATSGWQISPTIFLWWSADKLQQIITSKNSLDNYGFDRTYSSTLQQIQKIVMQLIAGQNS